MAPGALGGATTYTQPLNLPRTRTLILFDGRDQETYSSFFASFETFSDVKIASSISSEAQIRKYGEWLYDTILVFGADFNEDISKASLLEFVDDGGNVGIIS
eukprot:350721_1